MVKKYEVARSVQSSPFPRHGKYLQVTEVIHTVGYATTNSFYQNHNTTMKAKGVGWRGG
jgi:hypothetical protein